MDRAFSPTYNEIDRINLRTMRSADVVSQYAGRSDLLRHEQVALARVALECRGTPILELGVGGGRAVPSLLKISNDYVGIDYSPEMVEACRRRFPTIRFALADARDLTGLVGDASIGLAVFSCNGISMVGHADRLAILREVHRVLRPGGLLVFTTYNRNCPQAEAGFRWPEFVPSANPLRLGVRGARFARDALASFLNRRRLLRHEQRKPQYAIINDACHNYSVMLYYISVAEQHRQLQSMGFAPDAMVLDSTGQPMSESTRLDSMAFIARRP